MALAREIDKAKGLVFGGLMTYPAAGRAAEAEAWLAQAKQALAASGLACERISSGGTPDMWRSREDSVVTEASILIPNEEEQEVEKFREFLDSIEPEDFG